MLNRAMQAKLATAAGELLRLVDDLREAGDLDGALAAGDAADSLMLVLDLDSLRARAGA